MALNIEYRHEVHRYISSVGRWEESLTERSGRSERQQRDRPDGPKGYSTGLFWEGQMALIGKHGKRESACSSKSTVWGRERTE